MGCHRLRWRLPRILPWASRGKYRGACRGYYRGTCCGYNRWACRGYYRGTCCGYCRWACRGYRLGACRGNFRGLAVDMSIGLGVGIACRDLPRFVVVVAVGGLPWQVLWYCRGQSWQNPTARTTGTTIARAVVASWPMAARGPCRGKPRQAPRQCRGWLRVAAVTAMVEYQKVILCVRGPIAAILQEVRYKRGS